MTSKMTARIRTGGEGSAHGRHPRRRATAMTRRAARNPFPTASSRTSPHSVPSPCAMRSRMTTRPRSLRCCTRCVSISSISTARTAACRSGRTSTSRRPPPAWPTLPPPRRSSSATSTGKTKLPEDPRDLWAALVELDRQGSLGALFAHCASLTVNAVREPHQPRREALRHADTLAAALALDMTAAGWTTTADNYLGRVTKAQILEAVREARGEDTARLIEHMKKGDMAKEAERLLAGHGLAARALRTPEAGAPSTPTPRSPRHPRFRPSSPKTPEPDGEPARRGRIDEPAPFHPRRGASTRSSPIPSYPTIGAHHDR